MCTFAVHVQAQEGVAINNDGASPDASSILDLKSTTKGILIPRMTESQRTQISNVATGLLVYQTDGADPGFHFYTGTAWEPLGGGRLGGRLGVGVVPFFGYDPPPPGGRGNPPPLGGGGV